MLKPEASQTSPSLPRSREKTETEHAFILRDLEIAHAPYMEYKRRVARSEGLDAHLNKRFDYEKGRTDHLLEELYMKMGELGIGGAVLPEPLDGRGTE